MAVFGRLQLGVATVYSVRSIAFDITRDTPYTGFIEGGGATSRTTCSSRSG